MAKKIPAIPAPKKGKHTNAKVTQEEIIQALRQSGGILSSAAALLSKAKTEALGRPFSIARQSITERIKKDPGLTKVLEQCHETNLDIAELGLMKQIQEGNLTAIIFYLKCVGKNRGYIERSATEITGKDGGPLEVSTPRPNLSALNDEELENYAALSAKARSASIA